MVINECLKHDDVNITKCMTDLKNCRKKDEFKFPSLTCHYFKSIYCIYFFYLLLYLSWSTTFCFLPWPLFLSRSPVTRYEEQNVCYVIYGMRSITSVIAYPVCKVPVDWLIYRIQCKKQVCLMPFQEQTASYDLYTVRSRMSFISYEAWC